MKSDYRKLLSSMEGLRPEQQKERHRKAIVEGLIDVAECCGEGPEADVAVDALKWASELVGLVSREPAEHCDIDELSAAVKKELIRRRQC